MGGIGNYNFGAKPHHELYDRIHAGPGHDAAYLIENAWMTFQDVMTSARIELESAIRDAQAVWVGAAGEKFSGSTAPLVQWTEDALVAGTVTYKSFEVYTHQWASAKARMPEPVEVTSTANDDFFGIPAAIVHKFDGQTDQDIQEKQAQEAKQHAVEVMQSYRDGADATVRTLGVFAPPPQVTAQVTEPTFEQSEAQGQYSQQFSDGQWNGNSSTGTSRTTSQPQQPVSPPPSVAPIGGDTSTSAVGTTPDVTPRPGPTPITPPPYTPGPQPPVAVPPPSMIRPNPGFYDRRNPPGGNPPGKGTGPGVPKGFGGNPAGGAPRFGGGLPGVPGQPGHGGQPFGPGSSTGVGGDAHTNRTAQAGAAGARGAAGSPMMGGMAGAPQGGNGEDDIEHKAAPYLEELEDVWGVDSGPLVAPPVIGDDSL